MSVVLTWKDDAGAVVTAVFDVDTQETHDLVTQITEHPVEEGADVADHVRDELPNFRVEGYVTDAPTFSNPGVFDHVTFKAIEIQIPEKPQLLGISSAINAGIGALGSAIFGAPKPPKAMIMTFDNVKSRKKAAFDLLDGARKKHRLIRVITAMREYNNMMINQLSVTRDPGAGSGANFVIALKEIQFVSSQTVDAPQPSEPIGATKKSAGSKNAATSGKSPELISAAKRAEDAIFSPTGYFGDRPTGLFGG